MRRWVFGVMAVILLVLSGCAAETKPVETSLFAMNTYMTFTAYGDNAQEALDASVQLIRTVESRWSVTDDASEIYQANHSGGRPVCVSEETAALISFALEMAEQTQGALDPTIYPVLTAWGFTADDKQIPSQEQIVTLMTQVDYSKIQLEGETLTVPEGMQLDLGAVGKGYASDLVTEVLRKYRVESAFISLGGNIQTVGSRPDGSDWRIGIRAPWEKDKLGVLEISNVAVVTSGGYENYFQDENGNIYWHILDPDTGYPANSGLQSVLIVGSEGKLCDALSTALFVMGEEKATAYWRERGGFEMLMVTDEHEILLTEGIAERFTLSDGRTESVQVLEK